MKEIMNLPVGVSILTNGSRRCQLERCIDSLLENCYYRPLVVGIVDNGSTDDTADWLQGLPKVYGVEWRLHLSDMDLGCAVGTNRSIRLVNDCEFQLHLESDFEHLTSEESGIDKMWMHRALELLQSCGDYLYLRRMRNEAEARMHWWAQWMPQVTKDRGEWLRCDSFWWSNNPALFRTSDLMDNGTLPLNESIDGPKGSRGWSAPELGTKKPRSPWLHKWGVFVHERQPKEEFLQEGCKMFGPFGSSGCKYGFWKDGMDKWCDACDHGKDFRDMPYLDVREHTGVVVV